MHPSPYSLKRCQWVSSKRAQRLAQLSDEIAEIGRKISEAAASGQPPTEADRERLGALMIELEDFLAELPAQDATHG